MQVIVVALVMSFVIKRDSETVDYEDAFGEMRTVDDVQQADSSTYGRPKSCACLTPLIVTFKLIHTATTETALCCRGATENARHEFSAPDCTGGKCET